MATAPSSWPPPPEPFDPTDLLGELNRRWGVDMDDPAVRPVVDALLADRARLDWLEEVVPEGVLTLCVEFDGGVAGSLHRPGERCLDQRERPTVRDVLDRMALAVPNPRARG